MRQKFRDNASLALDAAAVESLEEAICASRGPTTCRRCSLFLAPRGGGLMATTLGTEQREIVATVREFVENDVVPVASEYEHADEYPTPLVAQMKAIGLFGVTIPEEYGGLGLDLTTYALIQVELSRGWMSLSGVLNTHFISAWMIKTYGTAEQRSATCRRWRPASCTPRTR